MRDAREPEATGLILFALILAIAAIPLVFAIKDSPPASNWHVTKASVWGGK